MIKKVYVVLGGGLGNQMFKYAFARNVQLTQDVKCYLDASSLSNIGHEKMFLDHLNISNDIEIVYTGKMFKKRIINLINKWYLNPKRFQIPEKRNKMEKTLDFFQPILNFFGIYFYPTGYYNFKKFKRRINFVNISGQSPKFFDDSKDEIINELKVTDDMSSKNNKILKDIKKCDSICVHIRRGDYVNTDFDVCDDNYYKRAIKYMNEKIVKPVYYVFSDDINYVKNNINFGKNKVNFVEGNNQFEDLKLMSNCKHFIIANSTFSFWAEYLSDNKNKIVIAPKKWRKELVQNDIYEDFWVKM